jgi:hypothetical protein
LMSRTFASFDAWLSRFPTLMVRTKTYKYEHHTRLFECKRETRIF